MAQAVEYLKDIRDYGSSLIREADDGIKQIDNVCKILKKLKADLI